MKKVLVLNFFPAFFPPTSGGELRYFNLYNHLSRYYDITLLSPTFSHHTEEVIEHSCTFRECRIPTEPIHEHLHGEIHREAIGTEVSALVCALSAKYPNSYHKHYFQLYPQADVIIHEFPYMLEYDLFFGIDDKPRIYNSHNFESALVDQVWSGSNSGKYKDHIYRLEKILVTKADLVFTVSGVEKERFCEEFGVGAEKIRLAPNGINPQELKFDRTRQPAGKTKAFFIGSAHPPNIEAADYIGNKLGASCPGIDFYIAGSCCEHVSVTEKPNVHLLGRIDEAQKNELFRDAAIAINPMWSGAGTNLKTLEFLSSGIPMVSSEIGVRGLELVDGVHYVCADRENFGERLNQLADSRGELERIARKGQEFVDMNYSWAATAENVHQALESLEVEKKNPLILLLNDFEVANPASGGEIRINRLYTHLSGRYRILFFCFNNDGILRRTEVGDNFIQISFPKTAEHMQEEQRTNKGYPVSASDVVNSFMCCRNVLLRNAVTAIEGCAGAVIFSHPYMAPLLEYIKNKNIIYESHNFESTLKATLFAGDARRNALLKQVEHVERLAATRSRLIITVSDEEHQGLRTLAPYGTEILTIRNGVELKEKIPGVDYDSIKAMFMGQRVIVFIGSGHRPNVDALEFIIAELAPELPDCRFVIIGTVCEAIHRRIPSNVLLCGKMEELHKDVMLAVSDLAINPMFSGSGSNLKLAEYFAHKLPVVTTPVGARGYSIESGREALICEDRDFADNVRELLCHADLQETLKENAYGYVEKNLDWRVLADRYHSILESRFFCTDKKKLLIVTYRFTTPPLGGAEAYLLNVIRELNKQGTFCIHVVAPDTYDIHNKFHFATAGSYSTESLRLPEDDRVSGIKFKADAAPDAVAFGNAKALFTVWMKENVDTSLRHLERYNEPLLMGGWHYPEKLDDGVSVWSSGEALIYTNGADEIVISAFSPKRRVVEVFADGKSVHKKKEYRHFTITIEQKGVNVVKLVTEPFVTENVDPRPLGLHVNRITCRKGNAEGDIRLDSCYRDFLREDNLDDYVSEMIRVACDRDPSADNLFQATRGPGSQQLEEWLDENVPHYDVVLGHSIPFRTSILAVEYAKKHDKPVALLPHFHFDDEFYHWNSYYSAMSNADAVISFPRVSIPLFFNKIGAVSRYVPGGGVFKEEFADVDSSAFQTLYRSALPFVLVLGRKSGSKNYSSVIDAVKNVNLGEKKCEIVLIGRDEDGNSIDPSDARYLGEQPRDVVLGALKECLCVVNMSGSESFGIVVLEGWMMKKPVLVNEKCAAFGELVEDKVDGLLVNKDNLSQKIAKVITDRSLGEQLGLNGFNKVTQGYTWESIGGRICTLLQEMIGSPSDCR